MSAGADFGDRIRAELATELADRLQDAQAERDHYKADLEALRGEREHFLHSIYDAWRDLENEAQVAENPKLYAMTARAILRGQLTDYPPFLAFLDAANRSTKPNPSLDPAGEEEQG